MTKVKRRAPRPSPDTSGSAGAIAEVIDLRPRLKARRVAEAAYEARMTALPRQPAGRDREP